MGSEKGFMNEWNIEDYGFLEERKWNYNKLGGFYLYWHKLRKKQKILSWRRQDGGSVILWATFSYHEYSQIAFSNQRKTSRDYCDKLDSFLLNFVAENILEVWIFLQDNAALHSSI